MPRLFKVFISALIVWIIVAAIGACNSTTSASGDWKDLGRPNSDVPTNVFRYCDGYVAIYVVIPSGNSAAIAAVMPAANANGPCR